MRGYLVRLGLAVLSLAFLYFFGLLRFDSLAALYERPSILIVAGGLLAATIPLGALRWHLLLKCQGFLLPFRKTLAVVLVGQYFNTFLPGAYGGDVVRAGYIYHSSRRNAGTLVLSILVDRLSGLAGLVALGIATQFALPTAIGLWITVFLVATAAAVVIGALMLPNMGRLTASLLRRINPPMADRIDGLSAQIASANRIYIGRKDVLIGAVLISSLQFAFALAAIVVISRGFDFVTVAPQTIVHAGVLSLIANSAPLTPGGIGVGEAAFANAILLMDPSASGPYATVFLASRVLTLVLSLLGGLVFLVYRSEVIAYAAEASDQPERLRQS